MGVKRCGFFHINVYYSFAPSESSCMDVFTKNKSSIALRVKCYAVSCGNNQLWNWSELDRVMSASAWKPPPRTLCICMKSCLQRKDSVRFLLPALSHPLLAILKWQLIQCCSREILRTKFLRWFSWCITGCHVNASSYLFLQPCFSNLI